MENILLEVGGKEFYLDIDKIASEVQVDNSYLDTEEIKKCIEENGGVETLKIDVTKYLHICD